MDPERRLHVQGLRHAGYLRRVARQGKHLEYISKYPSTLKLKSATVNHPVSYDLVTASLRPRVLIMLVLPTRFFSRSPGEGMGNRVPRDVGGK